METTRKNSNRTHRPLKNGEGTEKNIEYWDPACVDNFESFWSNELTSNEKEQLTEIRRQIFNEYVITTNKNVVLSAETIAELLVVANDDAVARALATLIQQKTAE